MNDQPRVLVAVATYNERENLPDLVARVFQACPTAEMLVIDDASPDGTGRLCDSLIDHDKRIHCIHRSGKQGHGTAVIEAIRFAQGGDYDLIVNLDADQSHPPEAIPAMLQACHNVNTVVIASRYVRQGKIVGWPWQRHLMSQMVNVYARTLLRLPVRDCSGSFRVYPVPLLRKIDLNTIHSTGYSFFEEILWHLHRVGATFVEVPYTFTERQAGVSKIHAGEAIGALRVIGRLGFRTWCPGGKAASPARISTDGEAG